MVTTRKKVVDGRVKPGHYHGTVIGNKRFGENIMIYELRTYTVKPGTIGDIVKAASTVSREIRKDDFGKLEGYWFSEIGPLNQVMHMWSYRDYDERTRLRAELGKSPRWTGEYLPLIRPLVVRQDVATNRSPLPRGGGSSAA